MIIGAWCTLALLLILRPIGQRNKAGAKLLCAELPYFNSVGLLNKGAAFRRQMTHSCFGSSQNKENALSIGSRQRFSLNCVVCKLSKVYKTLIDCWPLSSFVLQVTP